jgi:two-component system invasion response regulator UvrY
MNIDYQAPTNQLTPAGFNSAARTEQTAGPRILVAEHNGIVRYGLSCLLRQQFTAVTGEAATPEDALLMLAQGTWNLFVLDPLLPGPSWLDVLSDAIEIEPRVPILVFASQPDLHAARRALRLGAMGYVSKDAPVAELRQAFHALLEGKRFLSSEVQQAETSPKSGKQPVREVLSQRELHVMRRLIEGKSLSEISVELAISPKSISTYRARTLSKLGLENNMELMRYALEEHFL